MFPSVGAVDPTAVIASPCESGTYWRSMAVQARDTFWLKGQPYSLPEMLDYDALAPAFSKTPCINRGSKLKLIIVGMHLWRIGSSRLSTSPGAFFAQLSHRKVSWTLTPTGQNFSLRYLTAVATRCRYLSKRATPK